ncbi:MAG: type II secretion system protein [Deltaproteobacteria bacterium]|nr:type II secretion system protein [Deltaproteobacteria bacterium]
MRAKRKDTLMSPLAHIRRGEEFLGRPCGGRPDPKSGFTLIETLLAVGITAILATAATPVFIDVNRQAQITTADQVTSSVQTGITLYQMESLATSRPVINPSVLDTAQVGMASPSNLLFFNVLQPPITTGWSKEDAYTYRNPVGEKFVYNPDDGSFKSDSAAVQTVSNPYGTMAYSFNGIEFYDSGAIVDSLSGLAYIPNASGAGVTLNLGGGVQIGTHDDNSASITLDNGETLLVADINKPSFYTLASSYDDDEQSYSSLWVQGGQAGESTNSTKYYKKEFDYKENGGKFYYEYDLLGTYSAGSLKENLGYIQRSDYKSDSPQISEGSWVRLENGNIQGTNKHTYSYTSENRYGYNHPESQYRYAFDQKGSSSGYSETNYAYDLKNDIQTSQIKGAQQYEVDHDSSSGKIGFKDAYGYDGSTRYDKKNNTYENTMNYRYENGRDYTYQYVIDYKSGKYQNTSTDNQSGDQIITEGNLSGGATKTTRKNIKEEKEEKEKKDKD